MCSSKPPPPSQTQINRLNDILSGTDDESCSLVRAIEIYLRKFRLEANHPASEVLGKTYLIASKKLQAGADVDNLDGWLRRISYNVVRDISKAQRRAHKKPKKLAEKGFITTQQPYSNFSGDTDEITNESNLACLYKAIGKISPRDQAILNSRFIEELSWSQVAKKFDITTDAARKSGNRALKRLSEKFFTIYDDNQSEGGES